MKNADKTLQTYRHQWGARSLPFVDEKSSEPFKNQQFNKAIDYLNETACTRSVMLLYGTNGVGKSLLSSWWKENLPRERFHCISITQSTLSGSGLLASVVQGLGQNPSMIRHTNLARIEKAIQSMGTVLPVVILDEAQNYHCQALDEIRQLSGLNQVREPLFSLILIGDDYLLDTLRLQSQRALYSRIGSLFQIKPLTMDQSKEYLEHKLEQAGLTGNPFEQAAVHLISHASRGILRTLRLLSFKSWIYASEQESRTITSEHVRAAISQVPLAREHIQP